MFRKGAGKAMKRLSSAAAAQARGFHATSANQFRNVVLIQGARTNFVQAGTVFEDYMAHDLQREAIRGCLKKSGVDPKEIDYVMMGTVIQEVLTSNIAREAAMEAGVPDSVPGHTVTLACISSNVATATGISYIQTGHMDTVLAGGVECMSDLPIRFSRPIRKRLLKAAKMKTPGQMLGLLNGLSSGDLAPQAPGVAEFSTGEIMGHSADRLAQAFGVSRSEQDYFCRRSHLNAEKFANEGYFDEEIVPMKHCAKNEMITKDNGVRASTMEQLGKLKPAFVKPHGTITAANASYLTDGASASIIMAEEKAKADGLTCKLTFKDWVFVSQDPKDQLLLGPTYATAKLLKKNNLTINDIDVWEFHEAFAGQVLSNINAMNSESWCQQNLGHEKLGLIDWEGKMNNRGGSLSVGHPFGATGTRLITWAADRLRDEDGKLCVITACAAGGQGVAMLVERHPDY